MAAYLPACLHLPLTQRLHWSAVIARHIKVLVAPLQERDASVRDGTGRNSGGGSRLRQVSHRPFCYEVAGSELCASVVARRTVNVTGPRVVQVIEKLFPATVRVHVAWLAGSATT